MKEFRQEPIVVLPNTGEELNIAGSQTFHKIKSKDTNGVSSVMEFVTPPGKGAALHVHEREDELVYLLDGEIEVTLGDQKMKAIPGVMALLPRGIPHGFTNIGSKPSRLLDTILPGLFDNLLSNWRLCLPLEIRQKSKLTRFPENTGLNTYKVISGISNLRDYNSLLLTRNNVFSCAANHTATLDLTCSVRPNLRAIEDLAGVWCQNGVACGYLPLEQ